MKTQRRRGALARQITQTLAVSAACFGCLAASQASTVAYWRFEAGPVDTDVPHLAGDANTYSADVLDESGNGYHLSTWITGGCCGYAYRSDVPVGTIAATGAANNLSVLSTGANPGMFTETGAGIQTIAPAAFTIEASFKLLDGGWRTVVGRDSQGAASGNGDLAAVYFQKTPEDGFAIKFTDQDGFFHEAVSAPGTIDTFAPEDTGSGDWYHAAGVSNGSTLSLYLANATQGTGYELVAQTDLTASGSTNTGLTAGAGDGEDWDPGNWTVGRGMFAGGHADRGEGFIDEVRISDHASDLGGLLHFSTVQNLSIDVNTSTGEITLRNESTGAVTLDYYEITSAGSSLSATGWDSLDDQDVAAQLPGDYNTDGTVDAADYTVYRDGLGTTYAPADYDVWADNYGATADGAFGWTEAGGSDADILSELLLDAAGTSLAPGQSYSLGAGYDTGVDAQDLEFKYGRPGTGQFVGAVNYVGAATAVPEPTALALALLSAAACYRRSRG